MTAVRICDAAVRYHYRAGYQRSESSVPCGRPLVPDEASPCAACGLAVHEHHDRYIEYPIGARWEQLQRQLDPLSVDGPPHAYAASRMTCSVSEALASGSRAADAGELQ